jgi:hypothetical protein
MVKKKKEKDKVGPVADGANQLCSQDNGSA